MLSTSCLSVRPCVYEMYQRTHGRKIDTGDFKGKCIEQFPIWLKSVQKYRALYTKT